MEIVVQVCDVCQEIGKPVKKYGVSEDDRVAQPVLCADDGAPLERFLPSKPGVKATPPRPAKKAAAKKTAAKKSPARGGRQSGVMTMEEIEAEKRRG